MTYREILAHIYGRARFGMKPGLERITTIMSRLGDPQKRLRTVQIAGTNGKGSTGAFLSSVMAAAGYRTAFFSSPHLSEFSERFRINGKEAPDDAVADAAGKVLEVAPEEATFFEITTAIAFLLFAAEKVDLAIMEAGMGGRWDATNISEGIVSLITPISLDHCDYLGDTLSEIAAEKAGIIKPGRPVVVAPQEPEALAAIKEAAARLGSQCHVWGEGFIADAGPEGISYRGAGLCLEQLLLGLHGRFQLQNAATAITAAALLSSSGFPLDESAIRKGIASARWPGRMELFPGSPPVLLDGAHNPAGAAALAASLADFSRSRLLMVVGVMADKSWQEMLATLLPIVDMVIAVKPAPDRALPPEELADFCRDSGVDAVVAGDVGAGLDLAAISSQEGDLVLVCGSLFVVGEARALLVGKDFMPVRG